MPRQISEKARKVLLEAQRDEITEHEIYRKLSDLERSENNKKILLQIAEDELRHYEFLKKYTKQDLKPNKWKIWKYLLLARVFGVTFALKLMEFGELDATERYGFLEKEIKAISKIKEDEIRHERELLRMIEEERVKYMGSIVLGLNDALVELTGALAGLTFALNNTKLVALAGLVTGIAAAISMAASEYLSQKTERQKEPLKAAVYTGIAYILTVLVLIFPYLVLNNAKVAIVFTLFFAILEIALFSFYTSVIFEEPFKQRFLEMAGLSMGVALLSFFIGHLLRMIFGIEL